MTIHTIEITVKPEQAVYLSAILAITAINRTPLLDVGTLNTAHLVAELQRLEDTSAASPEGSRVADMSGKTIMTLPPELTVIPGDTVNYVPAIDSQSITTVFDNLRSILFQGETAHDAAFRAELLPYAGDASIILERTGVNMRFFSSSDLTMTTFKALSEHITHHVQSSEALASTDTPETFIEKMLPQTENHSTIINIGVDTLAAGYHQNYYYCFDSIRGRLIYSTIRDEIVANIATYFFPGMLMSATRTTVIEAPQVDDRKLLGSMSSASSSSGPSSSSSSSASSSPVTMSPTIVPDSGATSLSDSLIAISAGLKQPNTWKTEAEIDELSKALGYEEEKYIIELTLPSKTASEYLHPASTTWAQSFLPMLWIGNIYAMLGQYTSQDGYDKYDVIIDISHRNLKPYGIQPFEGHTQIVVEDNGTDALFKELDEQGIFEKIDAARKANKKVLINCAAGQSRSATTVIKYLMRTYHISFIQAYHHLKAHRPEINPNPGYIKLLLAYENELSQEIARSGRKIAPIDTDAAQAWLDDLQKNPCKQLREHLEDSGISAITRTGDKIHLKITDHKSTFIVLITFLKIKGLPFELHECDAHFANIVISYDVYEKLTGQPSSSIAPPSSLTTYPTTVLRSQASSSGPSYPAEPSSAGPYSPPPRIILERFLRDFNKAFNKKDTDTLDETDQLLITACIQSLPQEELFEDFSRLLTSTKDITLAQAKQLIPFLEYLDEFEKAMGESPDSELVNKEMFFCIHQKSKPIGHAANGLLQHIKERMTLGDLRQAILMCRKEGLPKEELMKHTITVPVALFGTPSTSPDDESKDSLEIKLMTYN